MRVFAYHKQQGFTLIELLVVIGIIAILSGVSIFALQGARTSGRDGRRQSDLQTIAAAIELYKADCNFYPASLPSPLTGTACALPGNTYLQAVPDDPDPAKNYIYQGLSCVAGGCRSFRIWTSLEQEPAVPPPGCIGAPGGCGGTGCNYCVTNP